MAGMSELVTGVISALISIILVLIAILKFYVPKLKKNNNDPPNPGIYEELVELRRTLQKLNQLMSTHTELSGRDHQDVMGALKRIEEKLR